MINNKNKTKKFTYNKEKTSLAENRTWTICTESRFLDHCATLPRITLTGKIIIFKVLFPWNSAGTFTVLTFRVIVKEFLLKIWLQIPRKQWWQKWKLLISYVGNLRRHFVWLSFVQRPRKKNARASHEMTQFMLKIAHLAISMEPTPLLERVLVVVPRLWVLTKKQVKTHEEKRTALGYGDFRTRPASQLRWGV